MTKYMYHKPSAIVILPNCVHCLIMKLCFPTWLLQCNVKTNKIFCKCNNSTHISRDYHHIIQWTLTGKELIAARIRYSSKASFHEAQGNYIPPRNIYWTICNNYPPYIIQSYCNFFLRRCSFIYYRCWKNLLTAAWKLLQLRRLCLDAGQKISSNIYNGVTIYHQ